MPKHVRLEEKLTKEKISNYTLMDGYFAVRAKDPSKLIDTSEMSSSTSDMQVVLSSSNKINTSDRVHLIPGSQPMVIETKEGLLATFHETSVFAVIRYKDA